MVGGGGGVSWEFTGLKQKHSDMGNPNFFLQKKFGWKKSSSFQYFFMKFSQRLQLVLIRSFPGRNEESSSLKNILVRFPKILFF